MDGDLNRNRKALEGAYDRGRVVQSWVKITQGYCEI